jgi:hypothetical protein
MTRRHTGEKKYYSLDGGEWLASLQMLYLWGVAAIPKDSLDTTSKGKIPVPDRSSRVLSHLVSNCTELAELKKGGPSLQSIMYLKSYTRFLYSLPQLLYLQFNNATNSSDYSVKL